MIVLPGLEIITQTVSDTALKIQVVGRKYLLNDQKGLTFIEIIAILIILGVLASFAVPKYLDLTKNAQARSSEQAIAEVKSLLNLTYAKFLLENDGKIPTGAQIISLTGAKPNGNLDLGPDFRVRLRDQAANKRIRIIVLRFQGELVPGGERVRDFWYYE